MVLMIAVLSIVEGPPATDELWAGPVLIAVYGTLFCFPVAFLGLLLTGLPLAFLLQRWAEQPWMPFFALLCGALAGRVIYHLVDHAIFGFDNLWNWRLVDYGVLIGVPTGLIWSLSARHVLRAQRIYDAPNHPRPS